MLTGPRWLLQVEGAAILALSLFFYRQGQFGWGWYALWLLAPDLAMLGYLVNVKVGAACYNLAHTLLWPICLVLLAMIMPAPKLLPFALVWISHLGLDRMLGYGLKYPTEFGDTHFQHV